MELGKCSVKRFSDGEIQINIEEYSVVVTYLLFNQHHIL
ncbi:hypothetical protein ACVXZZ_16880 [Staphylococcus aureus]